MARDKLDYDIEVYGKYAIDVPNIPSLRVQAFPWKSPTFRDTFHEYARHHDGITISSFLVVPSYPTPNRIGFCAEQKGLNYAIANLSLDQVFIHTSGAATRIATGKQRI